MLFLDRPQRIAMHANYVNHGFAIPQVAAKRSHTLRDACRLRVSLAGHQSCNRAAEVSPPIGIVGHGQRHQQRAQIRVADAQRTKIVRVPRDFLGGVASIVHQDFLRCDGYVHRVAKSFRIELPIRTQEFQEVQRRQIARRVVQEHVLRARI